MSESETDAKLTMDQQQQHQQQQDAGVAVRFEEVSAAAYRIRGSVERTPCNVRTVHARVLV